MNEFLKITNLNFIVLIIFLSLKTVITEQTCTNGDQITDTYCFNNIIILQNYYRAGQFATDKEGNMIIEYSNDHSGVKQYRLLYGLKKNGRNYFENDNAHKIIKIETSETHKGRYEARNIFVSLENDINKQNQYLFSTSAYDTLTELYDIEGDNYVVKNTLDFWNIIDIFSYQYSLIEWRKNNKNIYFCVFTQHEADKMTVKEMVDGVLKDVEKDYSKTFTIKKFKFTDFNLENGVEIEGLDNTNNYNNRIISSFVMEQDQILVVLYMKRIDDDFKFTKFTVIFYDFDLTEKNEITMIDSNIDDPRSGTGLFFKGLYLKENYAAFFYFLKGYDQTKIQFDISSLSQDSVSGEYSFTNIISKQDNTYYFISDIELNEFIKINDERIVFISSKKISEDPKFELHILLYDLYNTYTQIKIRHFYYNLNNYQLRKELTAYVFNGFLIFSSTVVTPPDYTSDNYNSFLVFFGYPNATDDTIDISPYLMDVEPYDSSYNIFNYLKSKATIENNIFGYELVDKINLVSIPPELLFYNVTGGVQDTNPLPNNTFFDSNHKLYQNFHLNKTFRDYYIDYQYIVKEPQYSTFYPSINTIDYPSNFDASTDYEATRKTLYGRTIRLKFKLCYQYCNHCLEFGKTIVDQKCLSCLEDYSYDYWTYLGKYYGNCIAINQYYDKTNNQIINCDSTFKYLKDHETNKKICFKEEDVCPDEYSYYNTSTNQCEYTPIVITTPIIDTTEAIEPTTSENIPICNFDSYYNNECSFLNYSESQVLDKVRELINSYPNRRKNLFVSMPSGDALEISNDQKELLFLNDTELPWIDLGQCGEKIRALYGNNSTKPLIIIKYGIITDLTYEKELQYEVYDPDNFTKIDLSICNESNVDLYIEMPISDELAKILKNIIDQGYNPFDINDKFYREICTPYDSENGTDVLLDAREEYYYSSLNEIVCPDNCHASNYDLDTKYLKCECEVNDTDITLNLKHITGENIGNSFYSTLKNSNWKVMICYNLVFNLKVFAHNYGSIISLIFFLVYVGFIVYYILKGIEPLQLVVSKIMFKDMKADENEDKKEEGNTANENKIKNKKKGKGKKVKIKEPPKKGKSRKENSNDNTGITISKDADNTKTVSFNESKKLKNEKLMTNPGKSKNNPFKEKFNKELIYTEGANLKKKKEKKEEKVDEEIMLNLDNFQLNKLVYLDACKYDKRPFLKIYWSVLMREHIVLFTFFSWKDYNLFYIKIERFLILICTQMAMNGLFFSDESMHKANKTDDYNFVQQLPKIIFSLIATHIIEVLLCYLSMTDTVIYKIKELSRNKQNEEKILDEIKCMRRKLIGFYIFTFLLFLFYWYFISAFCAVYQNTQKTFLLDSLIGIIVQFIDPFFIYGLKILLRHLSMARCANKKLGCVYKTSDLIPIF